MARSASKLRLVSKDRYRASAAERRRHGGATITEFYATTPEGKTIVVTGYGKTPGERKTYARKVAEEKLGLVPSAAPQRKPSKKPTERRYNDSDRMEWYATPANRRRGELETGDAAVRKIDENNRAHWCPLGREKLGLARNPVGALAKKVPPLHPAEIDILRELHQRRDAFLKSPTEANHRRTNPHPKDLKHPKGTSATPAEIVRGLVARGLVDRHWDGSLGLKLSGAQMKRLREIRNRSGTRSPAERNFFNFDVPNSRLGM